MRFTFQAYLSLIFFIILFMLGALIFYQESRINELAKTLAFYGKILPLDQSLPQADAGKTKSEEARIAEQQTMNLNENIEDIKNSIREIRGVVRKVSNESIMVDAEIIDLEKLATADPAKIDFSKLENLPKKQNTYQVMITPDTQFPTRKLKDIKEGNGIIVYVKSGIYDTDKVEAERIVAFAVKPKQD